MPETTVSKPLSDDWIEHHFDHLAPDFAQRLHPTLMRARELCPVAHSDQYEGFWVATRYEDVLKLAEGTGIIDYHSTFNRAPISVPITFTPGRRQAPIEE